MTNKEIASAFRELGNLMELHQENPFKIRSYQNAYINLRKMPQPLAELSVEELEELKGVGKAIAGKIRELVDGGKMETLERYREQTPDGLREMLDMKGFGPKKIRVVWKELGVESVGELMYAVNENRLIELKGFGAKTQEDLREKLEYFQRSRGQFHYAALEQEGNTLLQQLRASYPNGRVEWTGTLRRRANTLTGLSFLSDRQDDRSDWLTQEGCTILKEETDHLSGTTNTGIPFTCFFCSPDSFGSKWFRYTGSPEFLEAFVKQNSGVDFTGLKTEEAVFAKAGIPAIASEMREGEWALSYQVKGELLTKEHIQGVIHSHSTYSDGVNTLQEMAAYSKEQGYSYLGITDHSKSAFYANGLQVERVLAQMEEIDQLNKKLAPFRILKGIESDILNDGSLDYEDDILQKFDFVIASVHSNLRMDEDKATQRLIKAIENPYTSILGHPTGRLLLSRKGYPIDHKKVIDACAANGVAIELNANPYRLDLDWSWIPYARELGIYISINPDAHSTAGIHDIHFGVLSARKGGLTRAGCLNAATVEEFLARIKK